MNEQNPIGITPGVVRGGTPSRLGKGEKGGYDLPLRAKHQTFPWKRIRIKKEQDKGKPGNI